ncbi:protein of unknown function [Aminobacter niigataensis]|nr:protein of unknown function [Aminobacter niigataensis]
MQRMGRSSARSGGVVAFPADRNVVDNYKLLIGLLLLERPPRIWLGSGGESPKESHLPAV